jgi:riboflavin kinase/FMN adenylyltransferase
VKGWFFSMLVIEDAWHASELSGASIVTIGNFDGIHVGQQAILQKVVDRAQATGLGSVMVTFEPHPQSVLRPQDAPRRLTTRSQKRALVERYGVGVMAEIRFDEPFAETTADSFVRDFLYSKLQAAEVYVGSRFVFGRRKEGNLSLLRSLGRDFGFEAFGVEEVDFAGSPVSSTRIRAAIRDGNMTDANRMLGRVYSICGSVVHGDGRGKALGWPTINVETAHEVLPRDGVYASKAWLPELDRQLDAVTNIGSRPTFPDGGDKVVESHLFDFEAEIYGKAVELYFLDRLRGEQAFPSAAALASQIESDARRARECLQLQECSLEFVPTLGEGCQRGEHQPVNPSV